MRRIVVGIVGVVLAIGAAAPAAAQEDRDGTEPIYYASIQVTDVALEVEGERVRLAPVDRSFDVIATLSNTSEDRARDVVVTIEKQGEGSSVSPDRRAVGDIPAGGTVEVGFQLEIASGSCHEFYGLFALISSSLGDEGATLDVPLDCPGPYLYATNVIYRGGDGDDLPEPGERLEIIVELINEGRDLATDVTGKLRIDNEYVTVVEPTASWPDIPSGQSARNSSPFVIRIAEDAPRSPGCEPFARGDVVDGDAVVSSDGNTVNIAPLSADDPAQGDGSSGSEPGTGSDGTTDSPPDAVEPVDPGTETETIVVEEGTIEPEPVDEDEPVKEEPPASEPIEEEPSTEGPVGFEGELKVQASGSEQDLFVGSGLYCTVQGTAEARPISAPADGDEAGRAVDLAGSTSPGTGAIPLAAVLLVLAVALFGREVQRRAMR